MKLRGLTFGDRLFWSLMIFMGISFAWLKYLCPQVTMWLSLVADAVVIGCFLYAARPSPVEKIDFDAFTNNSDT